MTRVLASTSIARRSALLVIISLAPPTVAALYFLVNGINLEIGMASREHHGNEYQRPLEDLLESLPLHENAALRWKHGDASAQAGLSAIEQRIDTAFQRLTEVNQAYGDELEVTPAGLAKRKRDHVKPAVVQQEWGALKDTGALAESEIAERHHHLVADVRTLITHVGDTSALILDPDLDSYYIMDATLAALPQTQDRLGVLHADATARLAKGELGRDAQVQFAVMRSLLKEADVDRILGDVQTALNEDPGFYGASETLQSRMPAAAKDYGDANQALVDLLDKLSAAPDPADAARLLPAVERARDAAFRLWGVAARELDLLLENRMRARLAARNYGIGAMAAALLLLIPAAVWIIRGITTRLTGSLRQLKAGADELTAVSSQLSASSSSYAGGASTQASSIEQIASAVAEIYTAGERNSEAAQMAATAASESLRRTAETGRALEEMVQAIAAAGESSGKIARIIRVIDEISFQTNILSLNAAVEAARAGEAGAGFAVVADEVRNLAQRCSQAAQDTTALIEESIARSALGNSKVDQVVQAVRLTTEESSKIQTIMGAISQESVQQGERLTRIRESIAQLEGVARQAAEGAGESAQSAQRLSAQSKGLREIVGSLKSLAGSAM
jgi:methyl-accepting chemotaxis protein